MQTLQIGSMPCIYTDDDFRQVQKRAESGGNAIDEEVRKFFADGESQYSLEKACVDRPELNSCVVQRKYELYGRVESSQKCIRDSESAVS